MNKYISYKHICINNYEQHIWLHKLYYKACVLIIMNKHICLYN